MIAENVNTVKTTSLVNVNKAVTGTHSKDLIQEKRDVRCNSIKSMVKMNESDS